MAGVFIPAPVNDQLVTEGGFVSRSWARFFLAVRSFIGSVVSGQIAFGSPSGELTQSANLFWDNTANRLGVGTSSPAVSLDVTNTGLERVGGIGLGGVPSGANRVDIFGSTSGSLSIRVPAAVGSNVLTLPAGTTNFSATGGTHQVLRQSSAGAAITVSSLASSDISGTTTNDNAAAGFVGEVISNSATGVSLTNNTFAAITSVSLTAGDWDVFGAIRFIPDATTTMTGIAAATHTVSGTAPTDPDPSYHGLGATLQTGIVQRLPVGAKRYSLATTTTVYINGAATFAVSTMTADAYIWARRAR